MGKLNMTYNTESIEVGSFCIQKTETENQDVVEVVAIDDVEVSYTYEDDINIHKLSSKLFQKMFKLTTPKISLKNSGKKVGDLINGDVVVVILTEGVYKGGYNTTVKYELADFMDDEPPFIEVSFVTEQDDTVFFTDDLSQPVYELDGLLFVKAKGV